MVLATVLPLRDFDPQLALDMLAYQHQRNHAAYRAHRKRRIALVTQSAPVSFLQRLIPISILVIAFVSSTVVFCHV